MHRSIVNHAHHYLFVTLRKEWRKVFTVYCFQTRKGGDTNDEINSGTEPCKSEIRKTKQMEV